MAFWVAGAAVVGGGLTYMGAREQADAMRDTAQSRYTWGGDPFATNSYVGPGGQVVASGELDLAQTFQGGGPIGFDYSSLLGGGGSPSPAQGSAAPQPSLPPSVMTQGDPSMNAYYSSMSQEEFNALPVGEQRANFGAWSAGQAPQSNAFDSNYDVNAAQAAGFSDGFSVNDGGMAYSSSLGTLDPAFQGLVGLATEGVGRAGMAGNGVPEGIANSANMAQNTLSAPVDLDMGTLDAMSTGVGQQFGNNLAAANNLQTNGFQRGLQNSAFTGAQNLIDSSPQSAADASSSSLALMRQQAQPQEERAFQDLQENLFSTGRMGTSGGALQTEAFAKGLAEADISRQLASFQEGRNVQSADMNQAQNLFGIGTEARSLEDNLLSNAFSRFNTTTTQGLGLSNARVDRGMDYNSLRSGNAQTSFANQIQMAQLPAALRQQELDLALVALGGQRQLNDQALSNTQSNQNQQSIFNNAMIGSNTNTTNIGMANAQLAGSQYDAMAGIANGIGTAMANRNT